MWYINWPKERAAEVDTGGNAGAGVWDQPRQYYGASGAQSSILPALDAALGVAHPPGWLRDYLQTMRLHMPRKHRAFLADIEVT